MLALLCGVTLAGVTSVPLYMLCLLWYVVLSCFDRWGMVQLQRRLCQNFGRNFKIPHYYPSSTIYPLLQVSLMSTTLTSHHQVLTTFHCEYLPPKFILPYIGDNVDIKYGGVTYLCFYHFVCVSMSFVILLVLSQSFCFLSFSRFVLFLVLSLRCLVVRKFPLLG